MGKKAKRKKRERDKKMVFGLNMTVNAKIESSKIDHKRWEGREATKIIAHPEFFKKFEVNIHTDAETGERTLQKLTVVEDDKLNITEYFLD